MRHYLMAGATSASRIAPVRLPGWLDLIVAKDRELEALWQRHRDELLADAEAAGFEPVAARWFGGGDIDDVATDTDPARAWSARFCAEHGY